MINFFTIMVLTHLILAILLLFVMAICCFGIKKAGMGGYYLLKGAIIKPLEYASCLVLALFRISSYVWMSWGLLIVCANLFLPEKQFRVSVLILLAAFGWFIVVKTYYNLKDELLRDDVRAVFSRIEHKLCFNNQKLTLYPEEWSNLV